MIKNLLLLCILSLSILPGYAKEFEQKSPDERLHLVVNVDGEVHYSVYYNGKEIFRNNAIDIIIDGKHELSGKLKVKNTTFSTVKKSVTASVPNKDRHMDENYREMGLVFANGTSIRFRLFNDGFAYRIETKKKGEIQVDNELITLNFPEGTGVWFPEEKSFISHYEALYPFMELGSIEQDRMCQVPVLFTTGDGVRIGLSETDLYDYPGLFLKKANGNTMNGVFPPKPAKIVENVPWGDRSEKIEEVEAYIAKTEGTRNFPWRTFIITDHDADLLESNLNFLLARESDGQDFSWVKPGMVAWDWYNANNVFHVDFKAGINNDTYKYYIDFASKYGVDYIILDEGWSETTVDIKTCKEDIDVEELVKYGAERKVGIILWVLWKPLDKDMENIMKKYAEWGVKGIKVDFMQRADQDMVNYYERTVATAAKYKLMVDFHGAYKPAGLRRAYPNLLTYEGVKGNENNKWTDIINPEHTLILPFTRMLAGPMDFTPGSMRNSHLKNYKISFERPMSLGTRTHQVAMYVVYESPLQMMCESPTIYYQERETAAFIASIPVTWDETRVLDAKVGEYILIARRNGNEWYIGAMTNSEKRNLEVDLGFLPEGKYIMQAYSDGVNADRNAEDYKLEKLVIESGQKLKIELAEGGGWCSSLRKE